ncbi:MAG: YjbF family lipoprotein [Proteobacteria bacterium]|nr:YjbF family lipoprotein [Pseudomonadota bacterium]
MRRLVSTLSIFLTVAACGSEPGANAGLKDVLVTSLKARKEAKEAKDQPKPPPVALTRDAIAHIDKPLLRISAQTLGVKTLFAEVAQSGAYRTYLNNLKMSVTYRSGIITATRGFGLDLLSQGISITPEEMFVQSDTPKFYTRTQQQLVNIKTVAKLSYNCILEKGDVETITIVEIDYELVKYSETCRNENRAFSNFYWVADDTRKIWKSAQSIGEQAGFFITEVLVP